MGTPSAETTLVISSVAALKTFAHAGERRRGRHKFLPLIC
ncbi:MAG: hypothetical protein ACI9B8_003633 [Sulfitobacter sp.]|jgi:hypothetical protein